MQEDGSTVRDHLLLVQKMQGYPPEELQQEELPRIFAEVWTWFLKLHNKRQSGMQVCPLSWSDIQAFFLLHNITPEDWELECIDKLDAMVLNLYAKQQEKNNKKK